MIFLVASHFGGLGYNEDNFNKVFKDNGYRRGWCLITAWIGGGCILMALILSFVVLCKEKKFIPENVLEPAKNSSRYFYNKRDGLKLGDIRPRVVPPTKF